MLFVGERLDHGKLTVDTSMNKVLETLKRFRWPQWAVVFAFVFVLGFTTIHAYRVIHRASYWRHHRDEPIRGWMTVGYVAHSYHVQPRVLYQALGLQNHSDRRYCQCQASQSTTTAGQWSQVVTDQLLGWFALYGVPALFAILTISA